MMPITTIVEWKDMMLPVGSMTLLAVVSFKDGSCSLFRHSEATPGVRYVHVKSQEHGDRWTTVNYQLTLDTGVVVVELVTDPKTGSLFPGARTWGEAYAMFVEMAKSAFVKATGMDAPVPYEMGGPTFRNFKEFISSGLALELSKEALRLDRVNGQGSGKSHSLS